MPEPSVVEELFLQALEQGTAEEQAAFLAGACRGDVELRAAVERLLTAHPRMAGFLDPVLMKTVVNDAPGEQVGQVVAGRYKLLEQIGEGGMGTVWVAEQTQPVRRKVALKLIKVGMDSRAVVARFEAERQALALMDHPNIAKVLDGGVTEQGRPFFVMEYIKGIPLTTYCDQARLKIPERLALFVQVCQAVQHAHQKGVIHRDLKPGNILVCLYDGQPVPKVIDFGLAKALYQPLTEHTLHTAHGAMVGTPLYMSPEQAEFNNLDVDTRTDIYALGVMLYELLTGTTPLERQRFQQAAWQEMLRLIKEEEPPRPSVRLSGSTTLPTLAAQRQLEPVKLSRLVSGELDWVVMKALEKDRRRRYETANAFALDIQRYLAGETVQAHPPSTAYRLMKFARKHRGRVIASAAFLLLLMVATALSIGLALRARRAEIVAEEKRFEAEEASKSSGESLGKMIGAMMAANELRIEAETAALSARIDVDLKEVEADAYLGVLRLCATRRDLQQRRQTFAGLELMSAKEIFLDPVDALDRFLAAAILHYGQVFTEASLHPPITHESSEIRWTQLSPDRMTLMTFGADKTARLWKSGTAEPIALLREADERVVHCGFAPDGKTAFTDDDRGVLRFWDVPRGTLRAVRPVPADPAAATNRYAHLAPSDLPQEVQGGRQPLLVSNTRALTRRVRIEEQTFVDQQSVSTLIVEGPYELWDLANGKLVARLDVPDCVPESFGFNHQGQWISCVTTSAQVLIFAAEDGRLLYTLDHRSRGGNSSPAGEQTDEREHLLLSYYLAVSPDGRWLFHRSHDQAPYLVWDCTDLSQPPGEIPHPRPGYGYEAKFVSNDVLEFGIYGFITIEDFYDFQRDSDRPIHFSPCPIDQAAARGRNQLNHANSSFFVDERGEVYGAGTNQRVKPPAGHRYAAELKQFARDGRFVDLQYELIDTVTEKRIIHGRECFVHPQLGLMWFQSELKQPRFVLVNPTSLEALPEHLLSRWAELCVRGELDAEGHFQKWSAEKWEQQRQALAARTADKKQFPFPGSIVTDRTYWQRTESKLVPQK